MPNPITAADRRRALLMDRERRRIENEFLRHASAVGYHLRINAIRAFRHGRSIAPALKDAFHDLRGPLAKAMLWGHIYGARRAMLHAEREAPDEPLKLSIASEFEGALKWLNGRDLLTEQGKSYLETQYNSASIRALTKAQAWAEGRIATAMREITGRGLHVNAGMEELRTALDSAGLTSVKDNTIETLFRTQTQVAYGSGQAEVESLPAVDEILWGYTYCTTNDDRVRPAHQAMEGTTLPKDHAWWNTHWTPCGYNCRCLLLQRIKDRPGDTEPPKGTSIVEPSAKMIDGQLVQPNPDPGFGARPVSFR